MSQPRKQSDIGISAVLQIIDVVHTVVIERHCIAYIRLSLAVRLGQEKEIISVGFLLSLRCGRRRDGCCVVRRVVIHLEAKQLIEVPEPEEIVPSDVVGFQVDLSAVDRHVGGASHTACGLIFACRQLAAHRGIRLSCGQGYGAVFLVVANDKLTVRVIQQQSQVPELYVIIAVDIVGIRRNRFAVDCNSLFAADDMQRFRRGSHCDSGDFRLSAA